jgi:hypothetical protein
MPQVLSRRCLIVVTMITATACVSLVAMRVIRASAWSPIPPSDLQSLLGGDPPTCYSTETRPCPPQLGTACMYEPCDDSDPDNPDPVCPVESYRNSQRPFYLKHIIVDKGKDDFNSYPVNCGSTVYCEYQAGCLYDMYGGGYWCDWDRTRPDVANMKIEEVATGNDCPP